MTPRRKSIPCFSTLARFLSASHSNDIGKIGLKIEKSMTFVYTLGQAHANMHMPVDNGYKRFIFVP